jgi:hypothetical protein
MKSEDQKNKPNAENQWSENETDTPENQNEYPSGIQEDASLEEFLDLGDIFEAGFIDTPIEELVAIAQRINPSKPIRVVDEWTYLDIKHLSKMQNMLDDAGLKPVMLMALNIVYDSTQPDSIGNWVRTSLLKEFHEPGIFETRNRIYVMLNAGRRKSVSPSYIDSIVNF